MHVVHRCHAWALPLSHRSVISNSFSISINHSRRWMNSLHHVHIDRIRTCLECSLAFLAYVGPRYPQCCCHDPRDPSSKNITCLPTFAIVGAQQSGVSALMAYFMSHPQFTAPHKRDAGYLNHAHSEQHQQETFLQYLSNFASINSEDMHVRTLTGEASPAVMLVRCHSLCLSPSEHDVLTPSNMTWFLHASRLLCRDQVLSSESTICMAVSFGSLCSCVTPSTARFPNTTPRSEYYHVSCW